ncbi:hypothetical protein TELCIR_05452 [Teladorsagia circumcincta]|uniref:Transmembrane protein 144 n=1 Tax=Teladorsagia circumcincta TaxID=45464 RepID=A0A2G9UQR4_TELCI|nr:hypothetical protein TELCIR_05452 [Teladorsagia circumcincta]
MVIVLSGRGAMPNDAVHHGHRHGTKCSSVELRLLPQRMSLSVGLAACGVSSVFFGSMFVPIKKYDAGDGMFAQWMMSIAILIVGFIVFCLRSFPGFYPLAMLGGAFWAIAFRGILFSRVRSETGASEKEVVTLSSIKRTSKDNINGAETALLTHDETLAEKESREVARSKHDGKQRAIGIAMALGAGLFYGMTFVPVIYMIDNPEKFPSHPDDGLAYVFSHYFGIFLTSTAMFICYAVVKRNRPLVPSYIVLPSLLAGLLWAIAQSSFFVANQHLSQAVTFPIIAMLPGCIASAWSIIYFHEIKGSRNFKILAVAMLVTFSGAVMVGLSKFVNL